MKHSTGKPLISSNKTHLTRFEQLQRIKTHTKNAVNYFMKLHNINQPLKPNNP